ncbi:unnamed protein product [Umbelopsis sp. WA50703]
MTMDNYENDDCSSDQAIQTQNKVDSHIEHLSQQKEKYLNLLHMDSMDAVKQYISAYQKLLHDYNDTKDAAVRLLGKVANLEQLPIAEVHIRYNVTFDDEK